MSTSRIESHTRGHEHRLKIAVSEKEVWKAITDAAELANWFPFEARVEAGQGGSITYDWGDGMTSLCHITTWDPPGHLRTSWLEPHPPSGAGPMVRILPPGGGSGPVFTVKRRPG